MRTTMMAALAAICLTGILAADELKPLDVKLGLWETTTKSEMAGMPGMGSMPQIPEDTLAKMPPAQRAQIEARMKAAGGPHTNTTKSCLTKEELEKMRMFGQNDSSCSYKTVNASSSKQEMHVDCSRGQMKMAGDLTIERLDSEHVKGNMLMKSSDGGPMNMKMSFETRWLSSDCGDIKPGSAK